MPPAPDLIRSRSPLTSDEELEIDVLKKEVSEHPYGRRLADGQAQEQAGGDRRMVEGNDRWLWQIIIILAPFSTS